MNKLKVLVVVITFSLVCITLGLRADNLVSPTADSGTFYLVRQGDCLSKIAQKYGTTVTELVRLNRIPNQNMLSIDESILIKVAGEPVPASGQGTSKAPVSAAQKETNGSARLNIVVEKEPADPDYLKIKDLNKKLNDNIQTAQYRQALEMTEQILATVTKFKEKLKEVVEVLP